MPNTRLRTIHRLVMVLAVWFAAGCFGSVQGKTYSSPRIDVTVLDSSGRPVEGAIGLITWAATTHGYGQIIGMAKVFEGTTDKAGRLVVPPWSKKLQLGEIPADQPIIRIFKPGYIPFLAVNQVDRTGNGEGLNVGWGVDNVILAPVAAPVSGARTDSDAYIRGIRLVMLSMSFYDLDKTCIVDRAHLMRDAVNGELDRMFVDDPVGLRVGENRTGCPE